MQHWRFGPFPSESWDRLEAWESRTDAVVDRLEDELIAIRRHLHAHPEPSGEEMKTSQFVLHRLQEAGLTGSLGRNGIGTIADLTLGKPDAGCPLIAVRAELDALRLLDEKTVDYASRHPGVAHACGHDAHTAMVLGAALVAAANRESAPSNQVGGARLRFLFQPAEETSVGAQWMVDQGALEGVSAILGCHVDPEQPVGQAGIRYGVMTANCDEVEIRIDGRGGHAARPHQSVDPVAASAHLISTLYEFMPRAIDSRIPAVFTIGKMTGGYAANVIPERVVLLGSLRTTNSDARETLKKRLVDICLGAERSSGARIEPRFVTHLDSVNNHPDITAALEMACHRVLGPTSTSIIERPSMGGEDFSVYLRHVPGALLRLGCADPNGTTYFLHSPYFDIDERAIALGTKILIRAALLLSVSGSSGD